MQAMIEAIRVAFTTLLSWPTIVFVLIGTLIGVVFGALPGLGGTIAIALLIPITFGMDSTSAVVLFSSTLGGVAFGGSISAILINTPGTAPNAATCFDGYPLARKGRASEALGISATASALGAVFGLFILILLIPIARRIILAFSSPEFFWLAILGLTVIAVSAGGNLLKGIIAGGFGLMLSFIGYANVTGVYRYGFGTEYLWDGIELVPALIGLFAIAEIINLTVEGGTIAEGDIVENRGSPLKGVKTVLSHPSLFIRSSAIGTLIGIIPGAGGTVANFISYMQAVQMSDDPDSFGSGNEKGVIASEAANDAKDGGALLPTVVFGIPGSAAMAVLLSGLILHGLDPGRQLLNENLSFLFLIIFSLIFSNILTSVLGISSASNIAKLTHVPVSILTPAILVISLVGAFALRNSLGDVFLALAFGIVGFAMIAFDYSRVAVIIALILGPMAEKSFLQSRMISDSGYWIFVNRPISLLLILLTIASLSLPLVRGYLQDNKPQMPNQGGQ